MVGRMVCFVGFGTNDSIALKKANVSISLRGATSIATDTAHIVFMEEGLGKLCDLRDIARDLDRNVRRSWHLILAPNGACIAGAFTLGFGVMTSVLTNNVAALAALANGLLPLRRIAKVQAAQLEHEKRQAQAAVIQYQSASVLAIEVAGPAGTSVATEAPLAETSVAAEALPAETTVAPEAYRAEIGVAAEALLAETTVLPAEPDRPECSGRNGVRLGECLFERPLKRPLDDQLRGLILDAVAGRREQLPFPAEFEWHPVEPVLMVKSKLLPIYIAFDPGRLTVHAKLSMAARMLATEGNRKRAIRLVEEIADELDL
jgi:hypothetical protein